MKLVALLRTIKSDARFALKTRRSKHGRGDVRKVEQYGSLSYRLIVQSTLAQDQARGEFQQLVGKADEITDNGTLTLTYGSVEVPITKLSNNKTVDRATVYVYLGR
jgi:hypothetical protein